MKYYNKMTRQAGMTLIELTVVLLILIGLAGLLVPYVGSFTQTTHDSTNSSNLAQMNNALNRYVAEFNKLPPHNDSLINSDSGTGTGSCTSATAGQIYCGLANTALFSTVTYTTASNAIALESLNKSGMNMFVDNNSLADNKTFGTSKGMHMIGMPGTGLALAKVNAVSGVPAASYTSMGTTYDYSNSIEAHLAAALGRDAMVYDSGCYDYVAMGIGDNSEVVQHTANASPVFFPQDGELGPTQRYAHLIGIFQVDKSNSTGTDSAGRARTCSEITEKAKFLGVVANVPSSESTTLVGVNNLVGQGWENRAATGY